LTREHQNDFKIKDEKIQKLSQEFSNKIGWKNNVSIPTYIQKYFDSNCENFDKNINLKKHS